MSVVNSLTVDKSGIIYAAQGSVLSKIDPYTKEKTDYTIPFSSAGDLIFYNGQLYLAAEPNYIVQIDLDSTALSTIYFQVDEPQVYGLTSISGNCTENKVFALASNGTSTDLIELDMDNRKSLGVTCVLNGEYYDAASNTENGLVTGIVVDSIVKRNICVGSADPSFLKIYASGVYGTLTYTLSNGLSNTTGDFENIAEGNYSVRIAVNDSCYKDTTASIVKGSCNVLLPTAFTPNGDGRNDVFRPIGITPNGNILFTIYNRWGQKIFETKNYAQGWDGTSNGKKVPAGTYVYMLRYNDANNIMNFKKGTVILIR